jgi:predicted RNA-binding protein
MMCLATVYVEHNGQKEEIMHDVAWIKPGNHGLQLITLMGESRLFQANIKSIDLMKGSIILEKVAADSSQETNQKSKPA